MKISEIVESSHYGTLVNPEVYNSLPPEQKKLYKYTADSQTFLSTQDLELLADDFPFAGGELFRGLNFKSKEDYDSFKESMSSTYKSSGMSSWSPSIDVATDFAQHEKTYFPTADTFKRHQEMTDAGDWIMGYAAVVLKTKVGPGVGVDVSKTPFAKESEVLLPAGSYSVEIVSDSRGYRHDFTDASGFATVAKKLNSKDKTEQTRALNYLIANIGKINDQSIIDLAIAKAYANFLSTPASDFPKLVHAEVTTTLSNDTVLELNIAWPINSKLVQRASEKIQTAIAKRHTLLLKALAAQLKNIDLTDVRSIQTNQSTLDDFKEFNPVASSRALLPLKKHFSQRYQKLNSREYNRTVNGLNMRKHASTMQDVVKSMMMVS